MSRRAGASRSARSTEHAQRWQLRRWSTVALAVAAVLLGIAFTGGAVALSDLHDARVRLVDEIDPALSDAHDLASALLDQEAGISAYVLTGRRDFLASYGDGRAAQDAVVDRLRDLGVVDGTEAGADLDEVQRAAGEWQRTVDTWIAADRPSVDPDQLELGATRFTTVTTALDTLRTNLAQARQQARDGLDREGTFVSTLLGAVAVLLVLAFAVFYLGFRFVVVRRIISLADEVRAVTDEDLHRHVVGGGPRELAELAADIEAMRQRIVDEVAELHRAHELLDTRTQELQRSNSDLEQFAYVASHDLQEPLRKVASFCQLLQRRYGGTLDERGEQYIAYAVDGAKRMQILINDLLAFSRVGRQSGDQVVVDTMALVEEAIGNLEAVIEESGAQITHGDLPQVRAETSLLTAVFQNLIGNAVKFRGEQPPKVRIEAECTGHEWTFTVSDNGIGIDAEYAERVFVIFQRLHTRTAYPGTGIGLAMCRKIVEAHGGRIWLDTEAPSGTRFRFTLPVLSEEDAPDDGEHPEHGEHGEHTESGDGETGENIQRIGSGDGLPLQPATERPATAQNKNEDT